MRGFTLIETVIYFALFAFIISGAVLTSYTLVNNGVRTESDTDAETEGLFVIAKLDWILTNASSIEAPAGTDHQLQVHLSDGTVITVRRSGTIIEMRENAGVYEPLTSTSVLASDLVFGRSTANPVSISASFVLDGNTFATTRTLH